MELAKVIVPRATFGTNWKNLPKTELFTSPDAFIDKRGKRRAAHGPGRRWRHESGFPEFGIRSYESGATFISVGHRETILRHHDKALRLYPGGNWEIELAADAARPRGESTMGVELAKSTRPESSSRLRS